MKFVSYKYQDEESFGALIDEHVYDLRQATGSETLAEFIGSDEFSRRDSLSTEGESVPLSSVELLPPIPRPEKIVCAVRNYMDHHQEVLAAGMQRELSEYPPIFLRVWRSQTAHDQPIVRPRVSESLDWEGELAVVIGKEGRDIQEADAWDYVAGYSCYNDASVREWQFHAKQIAAGKNFENTGGFGPWMVSADEITPGETLTITTRLNDEVVQDGDTSHLIFSIPQLINYASTIFTLVPGDVLVTGTPAGVGWSKKPPRFMKPGDTVEVEIQSIGTLRNPITQQE
ncbi:fumarylacetoacetate hydrolase family protein [Brevibacterium aurantiacum]|uniref:fumarylacetoacetate hydrolase family protein n=1 Tax=Brevibacterium aurantiacum TaxID=273384 RepID=UPI0018682E92|nr:fumarylacetoacetate hydrolase family protein [Brevibacterium aurantiacum]